MVMTGDKAKRLSSVNHTTKTIPHHHHHKNLTSYNNRLTLKGRIFASYAAHKAV